jgi:hypothetical protein
MPPPPNAPVIAPVALEALNTIDQNNIVLQHVWQEFHWKAPKTNYEGKTDEDRQVVEQLDDGKLVAKTELNAAFCETAIASVEVKIPDGGKFYLRWWLEDGDQNLLAEHPDFSKANFDGKKPAAQLKTAKYGWRWDGRRKNQAGRKVFVQNKPCFSRIEVKSAADKIIPLNDLQTAQIEVKGLPYKIWILGCPKTNEELDQEFAGRGGSRWLNAAGNRLQGDCWIKVLRGVADSSSEDHLVFLGHGAIEATDVETQAESANPRWGAIATPHDVEHKAYARSAKHGGVTFWLCELIDAEDKANANQAHLITLPKEATLPAAKNPFCDTLPNQPFKDGVHTHQSFGAGGHIAEAASVGCTTVLDLGAATPAQPAARLGDVLANRAKFGTWQGGAPGNTSDTPWGPLLEDNRPGRFYNKQNRRGAGHTDDALLADSYDAPLAQPPAAGSPATVFDDTLHIQPTAQHAIFGGFLEHEIPTSATVLNEPDGAGLDVNPKLRIRVVLQQADEGTKYWQYHRLIAFGHAVKRGNLLSSIELKAWIPRMVQRKWNGNWRNLQVRGKTHYAWFIERREGATVTIEGWASAKPAAGANYVELPSSQVGLATGQAVTVASNTAAEYYAVFKYKVRLEPNHAAANSVWEPLAGRDDLFSEQTVTTPSLAQVAAEEIVVEGGVAYLVGRSELRLERPSGDFNLPGNQQPGMPPGGSSPGYGVA